MDDYYAFHDIEDHDLVRYTHPKILVSGGTWEQRIGKAYYLMRKIMEDCRQHTVIVCDLDHKENYSHARAFRRSLFQKSTVLDIVPIFIKKTSVLKPSHRSQITHFYTFPEST